MLSDRKEWLKQRQTGIGGSDAAAVVGMNPWRSAFAVYMDKVAENPEERPDNERMRVGRDLEDYVARRFAEATGYKVRRNNFMLKHKEHDFMLANIDRELVGVKEGLECKTTNSMKHKEKYSKVSSPYGPWATAFDEMAKKTVIKKVLKYAPIKTEFVKGMTQDESIKSSINENMLEESDENVFEAEFEVVDEDSGEILNSKE